MARQVIEGLYPDEASRRAACAALLDSIEAAHRLSPESWAVTLHPRLVRLNAGPMHVLVLQEGALYLVVDGMLLSPAQRETLGPRIQREGRYVVPGNAEVFLFPEDFPKLLPELRPAANALIGKATRDGSYPCRYTETHSPAVLGYLRELLDRDVPAPVLARKRRSAETASIDDLDLDLLQREFDRFRASPVEQLRIEVRRARSREIRDLFASRKLRDEEAFNREIWRLESELRIGGEDWAGRLFDDAELTPDKVPALMSALERGEYELHGNTCWGSATHVYGPQLADPARRAAALIDAERIVLDESLDPVDRYAALEGLPGFGWNIASGLTMLLHPTEFAIYNKQSVAVLKALGIRVKEVATYQALAGELASALDARDFLELDWFLFRVNGGHYAPQLLEAARPDTVRYWKIAPGRNGEAWDEARDGGYIALGWQELGDLSGIDRAGFEGRVAEAEASYGWNPTGLEQVWRFVHEIAPGDRIVANRGTTEILGVGTVTGPYRHEPGEDGFVHRIPVEWDDVTPRTIDEPGWRRTLIELDREKFERLVKPPSERAAEDRPVFSERSFELLAKLAADPTRECYLEHKEELQAHVMRPMKRLMLAVAPRLPEAVRDVLETEKGLTSKIPKNDWGQGGAWPFYWGAFFPKGHKRSHSIQLFVFIDHSRLDFGFSVGDGRTVYGQRLGEACRAHADVLPDLLGGALGLDALRFGARDERDHASGPGEVGWREWLADPTTSGVAVRRVLSPTEACEMPRSRLVALIAETFERLFPLVLLAHLDDPIPAIEEYLATTVEEGDDDGAEDDEALDATDDAIVADEPHALYTLAECAEDTGFPEEKLSFWLGALERKKQAILYGPPGTGKTWIARKLARHLVGGGHGIVELLQLHPAYAYEEFMQGLRPRAGDDGQLTYEVVPGRFLDFCRRAERRRGTSVLILDEINRAHLARVFGELMYLLEYRDEQIPLASGERFRIPEQVRIIGTMNTADRSIALVDHALRRRFAFLALEPDLDVLTRYHDDDVTAQRLAKLLRRLNESIGDPNYAVGISFFLVPRLDDALEAIWRMEIEPYLQEHFFDRPERARDFTWEKVASEILE